MLVGFIKQYLAGLISTAPVTAEKSASIGRLGGISARRRIGMICVFGSKRCIICMIVVSEGLDKIVAMRWT